MVVRLDFEVCERVADCRCGNIMRDWIAAVLCVDTKASKLHQLRGGKILSRTEDVRAVCTHTSGHAVAYEQ